MSLAPSHPPFRRTHRRTVSVRTVDTVLEESISPTTPRRPSTASSQSSFSTAYTTLEASQCFRFYLPHISTGDEAVFSRNDSHTCNFPPTTLFKPLPPADYGRFYHYIPDLSSEDDDVYDRSRDSVRGVLSDLRQLHIVPEQKVLGAWRHVDYNVAPVEPMAPSEDGGAKDFAYRSGICVTEAVDVDVDGYADGERFGSEAIVDAGGVGGELSRGRHGRRESLLDLRNIIRDLLRKLHLGRKREM